MICDIVKEVVVKRWPSLVSYTDDLFNHFGWIQFKEHHLVVRDNKYQFLYLVYYGDPDLMKKLELQLGSPHADDGLLWKVPQVNYGKRSD